MIEKIAEWRYRELAAILSGKSFDEILAYSEKGVRTEPINMWEGRHAYVFYKECRFNVDEQFKCGRFNGRIVLDRCGIVVRTGDLEIHGISVDDVIEEPELLFDESNILKPMPDEPCNGCAYWNKVKLCENYNSTAMIAFNHCGHKTK